MVYKEHLIELYVNGNKVELEDQESINMRFNNVLFDPTKISSTQAEYSFEFEVPATPKNNIIFDYANNLAKLNKFHQRYNAEVYADGTVIFTGTITINGYKNKMYNCNLVSVKVYSLDDIFGDAVLTDIPWEMPFDGVSTINETNGLLDTPVVFPFVSYGAFQKSPKFKDAAGGDYTSKFDLDNYNLWYVESFPPSLNPLETLRKAFEWKGYNVGGDAFNNPYLNTIYMSMNLADGQSPDYNIGNPKFGYLNITTSWSAPQDTSSSGLFNLGTTYGVSQDLKFPYLKSGDLYYDCKTGDCLEVDPDYNFPSIRTYNMLLAADGGSVTMGVDSSYMFNPGENLITVPADGFYKIDLDVDAQLNQTANLTARQWVHEQFSDFEVMTNSVTEKDITFRPDFKITTPLEIQLIKNYGTDDESSIELIKGKNNIRIHDGYPDNTTELNFGKTTNYMNWTTCYPHERSGVSLFPLPTKWEDLASSVYGTVGDCSIGYVPYDGDLMCFDPAVNPNFICGVSSMGNKNGGGCSAVIKNGYSWSKMHAERHDALYDQKGYEEGNYSASYQEVWIPSDKNKNTYPQSPLNTFSQTNNRMTAHISCLVHLNKNDVLQLYAIHRDYDTTSGDSVSYATSANVNLQITAASPRQIGELIGSSYGYNSPTQFDVNLRLSNFLNKETKISDFVQYIADAFNLDIIQSGKGVEISTKKKVINNILAAVDIDDRTNYSEAEAKMIEYPKSMAVKYKIDLDEWGAERSAVENAGGDESILNTDAWKSYVDSGYTVIQLSDDSYATSTSDKNLQFSYTWYQNFNWYAVNNKFVKTSDTPVRLKIPCISKYTYMIDGYDYEESMKHDGYGLAQRFWFKPSNSGCYVYTRTYPPEMVMLYEPTNMYTNYRDVYLNLSYKNDESSLLTEFFNINAYLASNYVEIDVYLTAEEYNRIKNGSLVAFDKDLYIPVEISGYDPSGNNPTTLKLMKKVA